MNIGDILNDIYKYYPVSGEYETIDKAKIKLKQHKIKDKKFLEEKIFQNIKNSVEGYTVANWTDNESCCYEFKILIHRNQELLDDDKILMKVLNGVRVDLRVFVSVLEPYFYMFVEETRYIEAEDKWKFTTMKIYNEEIGELLNEICKCLFKMSYNQLTDSSALIRVPHLETALKETNKANVFDCLFTDLVTIEGGDEKSVASHL